MITRLSPRIGGLIAALLMAGLLQLAGPERFSRPLYDVWQNLAPRDLSKTQVRIVWIDEASVKRLGSWPWSRYLVARLTEKLVAAEPKVIGLDILFSEPDRAAPATFAKLYPEMTADASREVNALPSMDAVLGQVIGQSPVVLARAGVDATPLKNPPQLAVEAQFSAALPRTVKTWGQALANIPEIDDVGIGHGLLNGDPDVDGKVRRVPLAAKVAGTDMPGFDLELARVAANQDRIGLVVRQGKLRAVTVGNTRVPAEPDGRMAIHFGHIPEFASLSALDVLDGTVATPELAGKIVIVGLSGAGTADLVATPLGNKVYGAEVHANAVDGILNGVALVRPVWAALIEGLLALLLVGVAVRLLPRLRPVTAALIGIITLLMTLGGSLWAFAGPGLLIDPVSPILTAGAASVAMFVMLYGEARRQRSQLALSLLEQRMMSERASGELSAARDIQMGMLPPRATLARFDPAVELDALIEPAQSVGGDFYDAIRIDETRVCFLVGDVTGKGVPAALFMALSKALTKSVLLRDGLDLGAAVTRLNDEVARDNSQDMFVTMVFGLLDTTSGALSLCNAGHENPWLVKADGTVTLLKPEGGPPLSVVPGFPFDAETIMLGAGDTIIFVSDGITEAQNRGGGFFGHERLEDVLRTATSASPIRQAGESLLTDVRLFENGAEATDDLTVLAFRYRPLPA